MSIFDDQRKFMKFFGQHPGQETETLYHSLVAEEHRELFEAIENAKQSPTRENIAEVAKEAIDCIYVLSGLLHAMDLDPNDIWNVVHQSNMDKIKHPSETGDGWVYEVRRRADGKVMKPDGWTKPDLMPYVKRG
jgi:predicted HAD superfamily Cof-like phosphohydrolase